MAGPPFSFSKILSSTFPRGISSSVVNTDISSSELTLAELNALLLTFVSRCSTIIAFLPWAMNLYKPGWPEIAIISFNTILYLLFANLAFVAECIFKASVFSLVSGHISLFSDLFISFIHFFKLLISRFPEVFAQVTYLIGVVLHCHFPVSFLYLFI